MTGKRSGDKRNFGGWILASLYDRVRAAAGRKSNTDVLNEALAGWLARREAGDGEAAATEGGQPR